MRWRGSWNMLRISDRVDGASAAAATPSSARAAISISALVANAARTEAAPKLGGADHQQAAAADAVAEGAYQVISRPAIRNP